MCEMMVTLCYTHHTPLTCLLTPYTQAAQALLREEVSHLASLSEALPGYSIRLTGHSLGAGVAALLAYLLNNRYVLL